MLSAPPVLQSAGPSTAEHGNITIFDFDESLLYSNASQSPPSKFIDHIFEIFSPVSDDATLSSNEPPSNVVPSGSSQKNTEDFIATCAKRKCNKCDYVLPNFNFINMMEHMLDNHINDVPSEYQPKK